MRKITGAVSKRIKQAREKSGLSQAKFGDLVDYTGNYIYMLETGRRIPSQAMIIALASRLGVSEDWLRAGKGPMVVE